MLDKGGTVWYISQARLRETVQKAGEANLENDTEERTRKKEEDSEDSKEFSTERC